MKRRAQERAGSPFKRRDDFFVVIEVGGVFHRDDGVGAEGEREGADSEVSPQGRTPAQAASGRARRSQEYRVAREEYAAIRALRERNWIAAHVRERRYELDLTQQEVARRARTSYSYISKLESGKHIPTILVLNRILAALDEQLLIGMERKAPGQKPERKVAPAPESMSA